MMRTCLMLSLLCLASVAAAAPAESETTRRTFSADVAVSAEGKVTEVTLGKSVPAMLADTMRQAAALATFEPALLNGEPAPSRTSLHVTFRFVPQGESLRAEVESLDSGGGSLQSQPPRYPFNALRDAVGAKAWVRASFDVDGKLDPAASSVESVVLMRGSKLLRASEYKGYDKAFREAVQAMLVNWTFTPDEVAGHRIAASVWVPVTFCPPGTRDCSTFWKNHPSEHPVALKPLADAVRLATVKPYVAVPSEG